MSKRPLYDPESLAKRAAGRVGQLPRRLAVEPEILDGARLLEVGSGNGECTAAAIEILNADAYGIDPFPRWVGGPYASLGEQGRLLKIDASEPELRALEPFDFVHSYTVFEHIERPREALENVFHVLKPGGRVFLSFNLHLGASAGHLADYLPDYPWIHLTHTDETARELMKERFGQDRGISWVNKLTDYDYKRICNEIGFKLLYTGYTFRYIEDAFYEKHVDKLGQYSKTDLSKNFMRMRLERPS